MIYNVKENLRFLLILISYARFKINRVKKLTYCKLKL